MAGLITVVTARATACAITAITAPTAGITAMAATTGTTHLPGARASSRGLTIGQPTGNTVIAIRGYFPRPRMHRRAFYGGGYGYRPSYRERPFFPAQARLAYDQPPEMDYGYPAYPIISYGTIAGGSAYAPAWTCY